MTFATKIIVPRRLAVSDNALVEFGKLVARRVPAFSKMGRIPKYLFIAGLAHGDQLLGVKAFGANALPKSPEALAALRAWIGTI